MLKKEIKGHELDHGGHLLVHSEYPETPPRAKKRNDPILELQLAMATSSINHEYARMEFEETADRERQEELTHYMEECWQKYHQAREQLSQMSPLSVDQFERDLAYQKRTTLQHYSA